MKGLPFKVVKQFCHPNLVSLSITYGYHQENVSVSMLLSVLSTMSSLEELSVYPGECISIPMTDNSRTQAQDVVLPNLSTLKLSSDVIDASILLDHLVLPSTTCYDIQLGRKPTRFILALERKLQGFKTIGTRSPLPRGQLSTPAPNSYSTIVWRAWTRDIPFGGDSSLEDTPMLCIRLPTHWVNFRSGLVSILSNLALSELKTLRIADSRTCYYVSKNFWKSLFTLTPNLQDLSMTASASDLLQIFGDMRVSMERAEPKTTLLPQLRALAFGFGDWLVVVATIEELVKELGSVLESRIHFRSTIRRLEFSGLSKVLSKSMPIFEPLEKWVDSIVQVVIPDPS
ncbi:hypothetical protein NLI96_g9274 [Meripilus lineatus]|uniref:Uncharacterized protein n=1 Tax=Meripilus lineatus TaxID=2056292 RepID=A0AAD5UVS6_9APHY|nr:hypothetical protein NLI96_g9274 [Physisporinus lineatus]